MRLYAYICGRSERRERTPGGHRSPGGRGTVGHVSSQPFVSSKVVAPMLSAGVRKRACLALPPAAPDASSASGFLESEVVILVPEGDMVLCGVPASLADLFSLAKHQITLAAGEAMEVCVAQLPSHCITELPDTWGHGAHRFRLDPSGE